MFELSVARAYLIPRVRQLSVSLISLISVFVIATVVWLSIVFFSAQEGIERRWTEKLIALTAPLRITPTDAYYTSYYYQIDSQSARSHYAYKSIREKAQGKLLDPYDPLQDAALPPDFPKKTVNQDLVKGVQAILNGIQGVRYDIFDTAYANVKIYLEREGALRQISQGCYLVSLDKNNPYLPKSLVDITVEKLNTLPTTEEAPILLPKSFRESGVVIGDRGKVSYQGLGITAMQEQHKSVFVAGFYDPGIIPIGGKIVLAPADLVAQIHDSTVVEERALPTGFNVHVDDLTDVRKIKEELLHALDREHLTPYWNVQAYNEYDFTKEIFQQMQSDKNLFSLISLIIIIVACSNIISMLIILVHDKKKEIAILRALGATKKSIAFIFGLSGFLMGAIGSIIGSTLAVITLQNLAAILQFLSSLQGFEVLSTTFYAGTIPSQISLSALFFVIGASALASTLAGCLAAIQAVRVDTSEALRNE